MDRYTDGQMETLLISTRNSHFLQLEKGLLKENFRKTKTQNTKTTMYDCRFNVEKLELQ